MSQKKKGVIRFDFPFGTDEWEFAYTTILYIRRVQLGATLKNNNKKTMQILDSLKIPLLCRDTMNAYATKKSIKLDPTQVPYFVLNVDSLAKLLVSDSDLNFANDFAKILNKEINQSWSGFEIRSYYLELAESFVEEYKKVCGEIELGDMILKSTGLS